MRATGPRGERHIDARIHQYFRTMRIGERERPLRQIQESPRGKILFADLDPFDSLCKIASDVVEHRHARRQSTAIRDVAPDVWMMLAGKHALSV